MHALRSSALSLFAIALASTGCAANPAAPAVAPATVTVGPPPAGPSPDAFTPDGPLREEWMPLLKPMVVDPAKARFGAPPPGLAPLPASCAALAAHRPEGKAVCADAGSALAALDQALARSTPKDRDLGLTDLEACAGLPVGFARALRGELGPPECAENLLEPVLRAPPPNIDPNVYTAMLGEAYASRFARAAQGAPTLGPPFDKARVRDFIAGPMKAWVELQATAVEGLSHDAAELPAYAKGVAAVEAGIAELRLVEVFREAPVPDEFRKDPELLETYRSSLEQVVDARKDRGRDAALVGLRELALAGVLHDRRVSRARELLSALYGGRRIDSLDKLLLPELPKAAPQSLEERLAARLPTYFAGLVLDEAAGTRAGTLRQLLEVGVPLPLRGALKRAPPSAEVGALYARARIELGRMYWRSVDFDQAVALASQSRAAAPSDATTFLLALGLGLRQGPEDAADLMRKAPRALPPPHTAALDVVASGSGPFAGIAAFDAALLHQLGAPEGAPADYWLGVARRYHAAAERLTDPKQRALAEDGARGAEATARSIAEGPGAK